MATFGDMAVGGQETLYIFKPDAIADPRDQIIKLVGWCALNMGDLPRRLGFDLGGNEAHLVDAVTCINLTDTTFKQG